MSASLTQYLQSIRPELKYLRQYFWSRQSIKIESIDETELSAFDKLLYTDFITTFHADLLDIMNQIDLLPITATQNKLIARQISALFKEKGRPAVYFALPNEKTIIQLCNIAKLTAQTLSTAKEPISPIQILLPNITRFDPAPVTYISEKSCVHLLDDESEKIDLNYLLKTHVLGETGKYLIPIYHLLCNDFLDKVKWNEMRITNPYPDYEAEDTEIKSHYFLSESDLCALKYFHPDTTALLDAYRELCISKSEDNDLLTQLSTLCDLLSFNDAHEGIGQMLDAGRGAYSAIAHFFAYWNRLPTELQNDIHAPVLEEIQKLRLLSTDHTVNTPGSIESSIDSCIANFKANFRLHIANIDVQRKLASIKPANELNSSQSESILKNIQIMAKQLIKNLEPTEIVNYGGRSKNMLCSQGAKLFILSRMIHNTSDLSRLITHIHENDLRLILSNKANARSLVVLLKSIEDLQLISLNISNSKRAILFEGIENYFFQRFGKVNFSAYLQMTWQFILLYDAKLMPSLINLFYPKALNHPLAIFTTLQKIMMHCEFSLTHRAMFDKAFSIAAEINPDEFVGEYQESVSGHSLALLLLHGIHLLKNPNRKSTMLTSLRELYYNYLHDINQYQVCSPDLWRVIMSYMSTFFKMISRSNTPITADLSFFVIYYKKMTIKLLDQIDISPTSQKALSMEEKITLCGQLLSFANLVENVSTMKQIKFPLDFLGKDGAFYLIRFYLQSDASLIFKTHDQKLPREIFDAFELIITMNHDGKINLTMRIHLNYLLLKILRGYIKTAPDYPALIHTLTSYLHHIYSQQFQESISDGIDICLWSFEVLIKNHIVGNTPEHNIMNQLLDSLEVNGVLALMPNEFANKIISRYRTESTPLPTDIPSPHKKMKLA